MKRLTIIGITICLFGWLMWIELPFPANAQDPKPAKAAKVTKEATPQASAKNSKGLGGMFAESLKNFLQQGTVFVPNGKSAQAIAPATPGGPEKFNLNFNNAPIDQILKFLSDMTKKVVMKSDEVNGQFTIMNPNQVTKEEAMKIIDAAFMLKGFTFLETDQMIVVLPVSVAKQRGVDVEVGAGKEGLGSRVLSRVVNLHFATPSQLKESLSPLIPENANIIADDRTKTLVITDTVSNINRLVSIIEQLDKKETQEGLSVQVFKLRYANATELARGMGDMITNIINSKMLGGNLKDRQGKSTNKSDVIADRTSNSLIIAAPADAMSDIEEFIKKMDLPTSQNMVNKTFSLKNGIASEVSQSLNQIAQSRSTPIYRPVVTADNRTNTVIVSAYQEDVESFGKLIEILDSGKSYEKLTKVYPMVHADAIVLSQTIKQLITGEQQSNRYRYWFDYGSNNQDQNQIKIIEDQRLNALIITARPADFPMVEELIKELDKPLPEAKEEPRVYQVKHVRASDLATILNNLFQQDRNNLDYIFYGGMQQQQGMTGLTGKVKVIADQTTNSLVVIAGTPRAFTVVEKLIKDMDRIAPEFGSTRVFHLKNADAISLSGQLTSLFQEDRAQRQNQGFFWYLNQGSNQEEQISNLIGNVRIVSETRTNSLLVTTSSQFFDAIEKLIQDLDHEISQVLIEILIVELVDAKVDQLGIDWPNSFPISVEGELQFPNNGPLSTINQANSRASILSKSSFNAALNILASNNKTKVVARPNIFTRDNQPASVEVITRVPVVKSVLLTNSGATPTTGYEDVGLKLTVSPHINDATTVTIDVNLVNGQVLDTLALETQGLRIPALSQRTIITKLTINNLETAVLSGVLDTSFFDSVEGIPGLMHIPILGNLFKTKTKKQSKTEMIVFITPYILENSQDRAEILKQHQARIEKYKGFKEQLDGVDVKIGKQ